MPSRRYTQVQDPPWSASSAPRSGSPDSRQAIGRRETGLDNTPAHNNREGRLRTTRSVTPTDALRPLAYAEPLSAPFTGGTVMHVFVLDKRKKPLTPCRPSRARHLLDSGRAVVHKRFPFTIRLKDRTVEESVVKPVRVKVDLGARFTGVAVVREDEPGKPRLIAGFEIEHRGTRIRDNMTKRANYRGRRRSANTRYRVPRFDNRRRPEGWLPPSL